MKEIENKSNNCENYSGRVLSGTPIERLSLCEVFVFGSNPDGHHRGGAARTAMENFGAQWGNGAGPQGQCYAIPTTFRRVEEIKPYADEFVEYVKSHPMKRFLITRLGCGVAGFSDKQVAPLFDGLYNVKNAVFSWDWWWVLEEMHYGEKRVSPDGPEAVDEQMLLELSQKYRYEIGAGLHNSVPRITIRYTEEDGKFRYTGLMNSFFFHSPYEFYVFSKEEKWKERHEGHILLDEFHDQCFNQGYVRRVHFAGVCTPFKDERGDCIYTGDIVKANFHGSEYILPVAAFPGRYVLMLDNHCIPMSECSNFIRLGTVFFKLDKEQDWQQPLVNGRCMSFYQSVYGTVGCPPSSTLEEELTKAQLTPSFYTKDWNYLVLKELGIEYNWRH
ncbi:MAG: hypothetical protein J5526_04335 [Bacteroidales bacterium]|nr:hypothetical protein [Bacteroidales bacterium]